MSAQITVDQWLAELSRIESAKRPKRYGRFVPKVQETLPCQKVEVSSAGRKKIEPPKIDVPVVRVSR